MDGFDYYNTAALMQRKWNVQNIGTIALSNLNDGYLNYGRYFNALQTAFGVGPRILFGASPTTIYIGMHLYLYSTGSNNVNGALVSLLDRYSNRQFGIIRYNTGLMARRGGIQSGDGTNIGETDAWPSDSWHWFTMKVFLDQSGTIDIYRDGVNVLSLTGVDTTVRSDADQYAIGLEFGCCGINHMAYIDNFHIYDGSDAAPFNDILPESRIYTHLPSADGSNIEFIPSAGDRYSCINENPTDDSNYIYYGSIGSKNGILVPAVASSPKLAQISAIAKAESGTKKVKLYNKQGSNFYEGSELTLGTDYINANQQWLTNPAGGSWAKSYIDASEWGVKITV